MMEPLECRLLLASQYAITTTNLTIPDAGGYVSRTIAISGAPAGATVTGIDAYFKSVHTYGGDLVVDLNADSTGSLGNRNLWNREGGSADNPTRTVNGITTFNGLSVNRTWYLYAKDFVTGDTGYIDEWSIRVYYNDPVLSAPTINSPGSTTSPGSTLSTLTPQFTWNAVSGATGYGLYIRDMTTNTLVFNNNGGPKTGTSYNLPSGYLVNGHSYRWAMTTFNSAGEGAQGSYRYFQTPGATPGTPVTIGPGSTSSPGPVETDLTPTFTWNAAPNATGYELNLQNVDTGAFVLDELFINGGSTTSYTMPTNLPAGTRFVWDMRAFNGTTPSSYATNRYFQTQGVTPGTPVTIGPGTTTSSGPVESDLTPTFTWNVAANATRYELNLQNVDTGAFVLDELSINGGSTTSYTMPTSLPAGTRFVWDMRAFNGSTPSSYATNRYFQTQGATPSTPVTIGPGTTSSPGPVESDLTPSFTWNVAANATRYELNLQNVDTGAFVLDELSINGGSTTQYTMPSNLATGRYVWDMRAFNGGTPSGYATNRHFQIGTATLLPPPAMISPGNGNSPGQIISTVTPQFQWQAVSSADQYGLYISRLQSNGTYQLVFDSTALGITVSGSATSYTLPANVLQNGGQYRWNMNSHNAAGWGTYSPRLYFSFSTGSVPSAPASLTATATASNAISLSWNSVGGSSSYRLYRSTSPSGPWTFLNAPTTNSYADVGGSLSPQSNYYYQVTAVNAVGESPRSNTGIATTPAAGVLPTPTNLTASAIGTSIHLAWNNVLSQGNYIITRSQSATGPFFTIDIVPAGQNSYINLVASPSTPTITYYYRVHGLHGSVSSLSSNTANATITLATQQLPSIPSNLPAPTPLKWNGVAKVFEWDWETSLETGQPTWLPVTDLNAPLHRTDNDGNFWNEQTIILTHGLADKLDLGYSNTEFMSVFAMDFMQGRQAQGNLYNILAVDWHNNWNPGGSLSNKLSFMQSSLNGIQAAKPLADAFAQTPIDPQNLALIGHSNGAGFMGSFARELIAKRQQGKVASLTALDAPVATESYFEVVRAASVVDQIDNYYIPLNVTLALNEWLPTPSRNLGFGSPMPFFSNIANFELNRDIAAFGLDSSTPISGIAHSIVPVRFARTANAFSHWGFHKSGFVSGQASPWDNGFVWIENTSSPGSFGWTIPLTQAAAFLTGFGVHLGAHGVRFGAQVVASAWDEGVALVQDAATGINYVLNKATNTSGTVLRWFNDLAASPVLNSINLHIPADAQMLAFDLAVINEGNNDKLQVVIGDDIIGEIDLASQKQSSNQTVRLWVGDHAGETTTLHFYMPSAVSSSAEFTIGNIVFEKVILPMPGDANEDGTVNFADFVVLANNFGNETAWGPAAGDFNADGLVNFADFVVLANNFGQSAPLAAATSNSFTANVVVPSPAPTTTPTRAEILTATALEGEPLPDPVVTIEAPPRPTPEALTTTLPAPSAEPSVRRPVAISATTVLNVASVIVVPEATDLLSAVGVTPALRTLKIAAKTAAPLAVLPKNKDFAEGKDNKPTVRKVAVPIPSLTVAAPGPGSKAELNLRASPAASTPRLPVIHQQAARLPSLTIGTTWHGEHGAFSARKVIDEEQVVALNVSGG
jgi:subtilisin-like proprotein convertase family protein